MKRQSLKLDEIDWQALTGIAAHCGCEYRGEPSWRRLIDWIASGKLTVVDKPNRRIQAFQNQMLRPRRDEMAARIGKRMEQDRQRQDQKRRVAGILPRGAQEALDREMGQTDEFSVLEQMDEIARELL